MAIWLNFLLVFTLTVFEFIAQIILGEKKKKKRDKPLETEVLPSKPALTS